jgi:hypothetical protein
MSTLIAIKRRRDSKANYASENTVLQDGQLGFEEGTAEGGAPRIKFGDGVTAWNSLPYINRKNNLTATADPTTSNDESENYSVGSFWNNINNMSSPRLFVCTDLSSGATWVQVNAGGGGGITESDVINTSRQFIAGQGLTNTALTISASAVALDLSGGNSFTLDLDEDAELSLPTVDRPQSAQILVTNNGGFTLTFEAGYRTFGDTPSTTDGDDILVNIACFGDNEPWVTVINE